MNARNSTHRSVILFLCTGNSCRSQMAEGWLRTLGGEKVEATSAGIEAHGIHPLAIRVMAERGIDIRMQQSKRLTDSLLKTADRVITLCGHAEEHCPLVPSGVMREHWPLADPSRVTGSDPEILAAFREVRDKIERMIRELLAHRLTEK
jgi:arsenate reductase